MQTIQKLYRSNYQGEAVVQSLVYKHGQRNITTKFIQPSSVFPDKKTKAVVFGNGKSRLSLGANLFPALHTHKEKFGIHGLETYGCNAICRDYDPDYLVVRSVALAQQLVDSGYCADHMVYAPQNIVLQHPDHFYLIPQSPGWDAGALATYLACFDGHAKVYLMGFDTDSNSDRAGFNVYTGTPGYPADTVASTEAFTVKSMLTVMKLYSDVEFVRVMPDDGWYTPDAWRYQENMRYLSFDKFRYEVDL